jgi:hypothetical protein
MRGSSLYLGVSQERSHSLAQFISPLLRQSHVDRTSFSDGSAGGFFTATQTSAEFPENLKRHLRFLIDRLFEFVGVQNQELRLLLGYRRGGPGGFLEEGHLSKEIPAPQGIENTLSGVAIIFHDDDFASHDHIEILSEVALSKDYLPA